MKKEIIKELLRIRKEYASPRKTVLCDQEEAVYEEEKIQPTETIFLMDRYGYVKSLEPSLYEKNRDTVQEEQRFVFPCMNNGRVCIFTQNGMAHQIKMEKIPAKRYRDKGIPADNLCGYTSSLEWILLAASLEELKTSLLLFVTKKGMVKITEGSEFDVTKLSITSTKLSDGDELVALFSLKKDEISKGKLLLKTENGYLLKFKTSEISVQKRAAVGVRGMKLTTGDFVKEAILFQNDDEDPFPNVRTAKRDGRGSRMG